MTTIKIGNLNYNEFETITPESEKEAGRSYNSRHMQEKGIAKETFFKTVKGKHVYSVMTLENGKTTVPSKVF